MGIDGAKFRAPVTPGCLLDLKVSFLQKRSRVYKFAGKASVNGKTTCECEFTAMIADAPEKNGAGGGMPGGMPGGMGGMPGMM